MDSDLAAVCVGVSKTYRVGAGPVQALREVDLVVPRGALTVVAGPSGSGKSTLLRLLAAVDRPDAGSVEVDGVDVTRLGARARRRVRRRSVGYVLQDPSDNLLDYLDAVAHLRLGAALRGRGGRGARPDTAEPGRLLAAVGLTGRADHRPAQLSGGEQQRLAVAGALAGGPALVVADEPTAELDRTAAEALLEVLRELRHADVGLVVASHDELLQSAADRLVRLEDGTVR